MTNVVVGATIYMNDYKVYGGLDAFFYQHKPIKHPVKEFANGMVHTNGVKSVWALLKRGYSSAYHHMSLNHSGRYVDKFAFRLNQGNC